MRFKSQIDTSASESRPQLIFNVTKWCDAIGDPTCHPKTSEHGSPVPASDVRSPAAAPHAADGCPAAAPAHPPSAECGHHTTGQMVHVLWVISSWATGCVTTLHIHCRLQSVRDSHPHHPAAVWFISLLVFPKTQWVSVSHSSTWPAFGTNSNLRTFLLFSCFFNSHAVLDADYFASLSSDGAADWPNPKLQFHRCCNHHISAGHAVGKQTSQL